MPRQRANNPPVRITITTSLQVQQHLQALVDLGLYGTSIAEAAEQIICEWLRTELVKQRREALAQ